MKKLYATITFAVFTTATISPALAASWTAAVNAAISSGNYGAINQIVAANPGAAGDISLFLLNQASADASSNPGKAVQLLNVATPLAAQIPPADAGTVVGDITGLLNLANDPGFQKNNTKGAAQIFSDALSLTSLPNLGQSGGTLHGTVVAEAGDFLAAHPDADGKLHDDVSLAQGFDLNGVNPDLDVIRLKERVADIPVVPTIPSAE